MKKIGHFLHNRKIQSKTALDDKSIFYVFERVIRDEYGRRGIESLKVEQLKEKKIFIKAENSSWVSEAWANRGLIIEKINRELGSQEINEISVE